MKTFYLRLLLAAFLFLPASGAEVAVGKMTSKEFETWLIGTKWLIGESSYFYFVGSGTVIVRAGESWLAPTLIFASDLESATVHTKWSTRENVKASKIEPGSTGSDMPSSAAQDVEIGPDLAVTGDLNADGTMQAVGGVRAKLRGAANNKGVRIVGIFDDYLGERIPASRAIKELKEAKAGIKASAKRFQTDPELQEELGN